MQKETIIEDIKDIFINAYEESKQTEERHRVFEGTAIQNARKDSFACILREAHKNGKAWLGYFEDVPYYITCGRPHPDEIKAIIVSKGE